ncbi:MAG: hypothetical protein WDM71_02930 [Ferruginibacter sp.]
MSKTIGVQVYEILPNGCLNGVYANEGSLNEIFNEISRKSAKQEDINIDPKDILIGKYDCFYFDLNNKGEECELNIINGGSNSQYIFKWSEKGSTSSKFEGKGWKTNHNQITIKYESV